MHNSDNIPDNVDEEHKLIKKQVGLKSTSITKDVSLLVLAEMILAEQNKQSLTAAELTGLQESIILLVKVKADLIGSIALNDAHIEKYEETIYEQDEEISLLRKPRSDQRDRMLSNILEKQETITQLRKEIMMLQEQSKPSSTPRSRGASPMRSTVRSSTPTKEGVKSSTPRSRGTSPMRSTARSSTPMREGVKLAPPK